jgi:hypothetical protein
MTETKENSKLLKNKLALETNTAYKKQFERQFKTTARTVSVEIKSERND